MGKIQKSRIGYKPSIAGFIIIAIVIAVLPLLIVQPENRSGYFWHRILWAEFLNIIVWAFQGNWVAILFPTRKDSKRLAGMFPALGIVIILYACASLALLVAHSWYPNYDILNRFHLPAQVIVAALALLTSIFMSYSPPAHSHDAEPIPQGVQSPSDLGALLRAEEERFSPTSLKGNAQDEEKRLHDALKSLREKIIYSLPGAGAIGKNESYISFAKAVQIFCQDVSALNSSNEQSKTLFLQAINQADQLKRKVDLIIDNLKRR